MGAPKIVAVDVETLGLDPATHDIWEIALVEREPGDRVDAEHHWFLKPKRLQFADPNALQLNRFYERTKGIPEAIGKGDSGPTPAPGSPETKQWWSQAHVAREVAMITANAVLIGSNPYFDMTFLNLLLCTNGLTPAWHYRPIDVATMAYGYEVGCVSEANKQIPPGSDAPVFELPDEVLAHHPRISSAALAGYQDVPKPNGKSAHTAMGDARWAMRWYDALIGGAA